MIAGDINMRMKNNDNNNKNNGNTISIDKALNTGIFGWFTVWTHTRCVLHLHSLGSVSICRSHWEHNYDSPYHRMNILWGHVAHIYMPLI